MLIDPIVTKDKLGREVVLRAAREDEAGMMIEYLRATAGETPFLTREPDEIAFTEEQEANFIRSVNESPRNLMLIAFVNGRHAGNCSLDCIGRKRRFAHRCTIGIALYKEFCGAGIGRLMLGTLLDIARSLGYEQAELEVAAKNQHAIALYESLGFAEYGRLPDNMKYSDGSYGDCLWMMKKL